VVNDWKAIPDSITRHRHTLPSLSPLLSPAGFFALSLSLRSTPLCGVQTCSRAAAAAAAEGNSCLVGVEYLSRAGSSRAARSAARERQQQQSWGESRRRGRRRREEEQCQRLPSAEKRSKRGRRLVAPKPTRALSIRCSLLGENGTEKMKKESQDPKDAKAEQPSLLPFLPSRGNI